MLWPADKIQRTQIPPATPLFAAVDAKTASNSDRQCSCREWCRPCSGLNRLWGRQGPYIPRLRNPAHGMKAERQTAMESTASPEQLIRTADVCNRWKADTTSKGVL